MAVAKEVTHVDRFAKSINKNMNFGLFV